MKKLLTSLLVLLSITVFAQKRAYVLHDSLYGQIRKVEVRFFKLSYDKSGKLIKKSDISNSKVEYQLDDNHFVFREERWFDYSSLDPSGKTKPKSTIFNYTAPTEAPKKYDTIKKETDTSYISVIKLGEKNYEYEYRIVNKKDPNITWVTWADKNGDIVGKVRYHYDNDQIASRTRFYSPGYTKPIQIEQYNDHGFLDVSHFFNSDGTEYLTREYHYKFDDWGNYTKYQITERKEGSKEFIPISEEEYYYSYNSKPQANQPLKKANETEEKKDKKSLKDRLNIFKKKDGN